MENSWRNERKKKERKKRKKEKKKRQESQLEHRMTGSWKRRTKSCIALSTYRSTIPTSKAFARSFFPRFFPLSHSFYFLRPRITLVSSINFSLARFSRLTFVSNLLFLSNRCHLRIKAIIDTEKYVSADRWSENQIVIKSIITKLHWRSLSSISRTVNLYLYKR